MSGRAENKHCLNVQSKSEEQTTTKYDFMFPSANIFCAIFSPTLKRLANKIFQTTRPDLTQEISRVLIAANGNDGEHRTVNVVHCVERWMFVHQTNWLRQQQFAKVLWPNYGTSSRVVKVKYAVLHSSSRKIKQ